MKKILFFALILGFTSCKEKEVAPILSEVLQGNYNVTVVKVQGLALSVPFTNPVNNTVTTATISTTKKSDTLVSSTVTTTTKTGNGNTTTTPYNLGDFTLSGDGKTTITITQNGTNVGTYDVVTKTLYVKGKVASPLDNTQTDAELTAVKL